MKNHRYILFDNKEDNIKYSYHIEFFLDKESKFGIDKNGMLTVGVSNLIYRMYGGVLYLRWFLSQIKLYILKFNSVILLGSNDESKIFNKGFKICINKHTK